jgi:exosortase K
MGQSLRQSLIWWLPVFTLAFLLKLHYSSASAAELGWILQPLSDVLSLVTGHEFHRDTSGEWVSLSADVRLVKSCAGINFMLMSLVTFAWTFRPDPKEASGFIPRMAGHLALLASVSVAAWSMGLVANSLRILVAMSLQTEDSLLLSLGLDDSQIHRFIGLAVYLPLLTLQMLPVQRISRRQRLIIPALLYGALMVVVPLLTGNALRNPALFLEHLTQLTIGIAVIQLLLFWLMKQRLVMIEKPASFKS